MQSRNAGVKLASWQDDNLLADEGKSEHINKRIAKHQTLVGTMELAGWLKVSKQNRWAVTYATLLNNK